MIKKILSIIFIIALLTSCASESNNCDIFEFIKRVNNLSESEIVNIDDINVSQNNILYWCPESEICLSFYINDSSGNIEKCNIAYTKGNEKLFNLINKALTYNNKYMSKECFKTEKFYLISYYDTRYIKTDEKYTLKKEINEKNLY